MTSRSMFVQAVLLCQLIQGTSAAESLTQHLMISEFRAVPNGSISEHISKTWMVLKTHGANQQSRPVISRFQRSRWFHSRREEKRKGRKEKGKSGCWFDKSTASQTTSGILSLSHGWSV